MYSINTTIISLKNIHRVKARQPGKAGGEGDRKDGYENRSVNGGGIEAIYIGWEMFAVFQWGLREEGCHGVGLVGMRDSKQRGNGGKE